VTLTPSAVMVGQPSTTTVTVTDNGITNPVGAADSWIATSGTPTVGTSGSTATLFADGMVLVAGGTNASGMVVASAYAYNAVSKTFTATTGSLNTARTGATATLLANGQILIAGGSSDGTPTSALNTAELYNPVTGAFTVAGANSNPTNTMTAARFGATATLLTNGQVLIAGGENSGGALSSAELYNPATDTFTATGNLGTARYDAAAMLLANGIVLIAGGTGASGTLNSAELYAAGTFTSAAGTMTAARTGATATLLLSGNVLVAGGSTDGSTPLNTAELYNPTPGTFTLSNSTLNTARFNHSATLLPSSMVLLVGGANGSTAELYDPDSDKFDATGGLLNTDQPSLTATLLNKDHVLITGLTSGGSPVADAELYTPSFNPLGTVALSSSEPTDGFGGTCVLTPSSGSPAASTCTTTVTPSNVATSPHTITGTYPADAVHSGSDNTASLTVNVCTSNCAVGVACTSDANCSSNACNASTNLCVSNQCADNRQDGNETDVDCGGGTCSACSLGLKCIVDTDCSSNACNASTNLCVSNQCSDNRQDGAETDIDCGGGTCSACSLNQKCIVDSDCASNACDALSLTCVANQCTDHRQDGTETDVDCGGLNSCARCASGQACNINSDCQPGLFCSSGVCH
jgi:N-acetylneuraminic acid mutarotase